MLQPKTRLQLEALCLRALRATPSYAGAQSVVVMEVPADASGANWDIAAISPKPPRGTVRIGEAEIAIRPLKGRYRLTH